MKASARLDLFLPPSLAAFRPADVAGFYGNFAAELQRAGFSAVEKEKLLHRKMLGRLYREPRFFLHRFVPCVAAAVSSCFSQGRNPRALELGCGSGSLSLLLALLGARVLAIDLDPDMISVGRKRAALYRENGCDLKLSFICADALRFNYAEAAPLDAIYSVYAFNLMPSPRRLLASLAAALGSGGRIRIVDGNSRSLYNRCFRRRQVLSPAETAGQLRACGLSCTELSYQGILPPFMAATPRRLQIGRSMEKGAAVCGLLPHLAVSYTLESRKPAEN